MTLKFKTLIGVFLLTAVASSFHSAAIAQPSLGRRLRSSEPINTTFERAFLKMILSFSVIVRLNVK